MPVVTAKYMLVYRIKSLEFESEKMRKAYLKVETSVYNPLIQMSHFTNESTLDFKDQLDKAPEYECVLLGSLPGNVRMAGCFPKHYFMNL